MYTLHLGNFLEPQLFGKSLNLTAISVLIALILWGYVWGLVRSSAPASCLVLSRLHAQY